MAAEKITEVELESIRLLEANQRKLSLDAAAIKITEEDVNTEFGPLHIIVHGDTRFPAIMTYHDIGLNSTSCFQGFFNYPDMQVITKHFCVYHVNALGQQEGAPTLPSGLNDAAKSYGPYVYPTMDELSKMLLPVCEHFKLKTFIGLGVGTGANVLSRFALSHPNKVDALILINGSASQAGWIEWGYQKWNAWYLKSGMMTAGVEDYLLWHWFGNKTMDDNHDLVSVYTEYIKSLNPVNLGHYISSYIKRSDFAIYRELDNSKKAAVKQFKCPVMLVAGDYSPHLDDTIEFNGRLDPANSTWMKFACGGMVMEEAPGRLCEAFRLFLQGMGYVPTIRLMTEINPSPVVPTLSALRRGSQNQPAITVTENC